MHNFRSIKDDDVTGQFKLAEDAVQEERTFLKYTESVTWPFGIKHLKHNILMTSMMDEAITNDCGNKLIVLEYFRIRMQRLSPGYI